jgi:two-component system, cell cycle sensor histidine kinase and response regulator CckA
MPSDSLKVQELQRILFEEAGDGMFIASPDWRYITVNPRYCEMTGYSHDELLKMTYLDVIHSEDFAYNPIPMDDLLLGHTVTRERQIINKGGSLVPVEIRARMLPEGNILAITRDITERKQAEKAFLRENEFCRAIVERATEGLCVGYNIAEFPYVRFTVWNPRIAEITGYTLEEINLHGWYQSLYPDSRDQAEAQDYVARIHQGEDFFGQERVITTAKGEKRVVSISTSVLDTTPDCTYALALVHDITERKRAEEVSARERTFSDDIVNSLPGIFYMSDTEGKLVRWNKKFETKTGYSHEELHDMCLLDFFSETQRPYIDLRVQSVFAEGESTAEAPLLVKNGNQIPHYFTGRLIILDGEQYLIGVGIDISERVRTEEEKEKLQVQLMQAQKMDSVGRLAGGVAHDFNNMLTGILGHAELALLKCTPSEQGVYSDLQVIQTTALRSADLVRQLLAFARKQTIAPKVLNINDAVAGLLKLLLRILGEDLDLAWIPKAGLWPVKIDPSQLDQIVMNLCINARDAITGVGKVTIETENCTICESYCQGNPEFICGDYVVFAVSDNGEGMSKDVRNLIFEPFFTTKERGKGVGLGLATIYGIVKQNNGFVNVYSEPGKGSTFKIYLPRFDGETTGEAIGHSRETPRGHGETLLLVEDEPVILEVGRKMLEQLGYTVLTANTPNEALRHAKTDGSQIRLLITDVVMPEMNGRELADLIYEIMPGINCLFTSGYTSNVIVHHDILDEDVHFLQKPFSIQDLADKVRQILDNVR